MRWLALALLFVASAASAQFVALLQNSPAQLFDDEDLRLFLDAARKALDDGAVDQKYPWQNAKNGHRGEFTVVSKFESQGRTCKRIGVHNEAQGRKSDMRHNLCVVDGRWRLLGDMKKEKAKGEAK
jgi:surface antigen